MCLSAHVAGREEGERKVWEGTFVHEVCPANINQVCLRPPVTPSLSVSSRYWLAWGKSDELPIPRLGYERTRALSCPLSFALFWLTLMETSWLVVSCPTYTGAPVTSNWERPQRTATEEQRPLVQQSTRSWIPTRKMGVSWEMDHLQLCRDETTASGYTLTETGEKPWWRGSR